jgi:hypothetical protein
MFTNAKIALAAALMLGAASAALANDIDTNPSEAQSSREWAEYLGQNQKHMANARIGYGYASPTQQEDLSQSRKNGHNH